MNFIKYKIAEEEGTFWFSLFLVLGVAVAFFVAVFFTFYIVKMNKTQNVLWSLPVLTYFIFTLWAILTGKMNF